MKINKLLRLREYSIFFWLILITILGVVITTIHSKNKIEQSKKIQSSLDNLYLKKVVKEITSSLKPRYSVIKYVTVSGDTHESILNKLDIDKEEKAILLKAILKEKFSTNQMLRIFLYQRKLKKIIQKILFIKKLL